MKLNVKNIIICTNRNVSAFLLFCLYHLGQMFKRGGNEMKKFTKTLLLTIGLLVGFTVNAHAVSAATLTQTDSGYWYDRAKADGSDHHSWHYTLYDIDGEVAYCIQPNTKEGVNYNQGTWEDVNLPNSIKERLLLIGY